MTDDLTPDAIEPLTYSYGDLWRFADYFGIKLPERFNLYDADAVADPEDHRFACGLFLLVLDATGRGWSDEICDEVLTGDGVLSRCS